MPVHAWWQPGIGHGSRSIIVSVASCGCGLIWGDQESLHHWETVSRMVGRITCGVVSSGESLISVLRSLVWVVGQMANARAQAGLGEKSGIAVCIDWKVWQVC